jgi:hypothetical protein
MKPQLAVAIWLFARFNRCDKVRVEMVRPGKLKAPLRRCVVAAQQA